MWHLSVYIEAPKETLSKSL